MAKQNRYPVVLSDPEVAMLEEICRKGTHKARRIMRCRVLLAVHRGLGDKDICRSENIGRTTPLDIRKRFCAGGIERAINDAARPGRPPLLEKHENVQVLAIACSEPPDGRECWTIKLITRKAREQTGKEVSRSTIGRVLLENSIKPWREKNVVRC